MISLWDKIATKKLFLHSIESVQPMHEMNNTKKAACCKRVPFLPF